MTLIARLRQWPLWRQPGRLTATLLLIELGAVALTLAATVDREFRVHLLMRAALLLGLGILFEEVASVHARLRWRLIKSSYIDMTSVWIFAGASTLQPRYAVGLAITLNAYLWWRHQRHQEIPAFREFANTSVIVISCVAASVVAGLVRGLYGFDIAAVLAGIITYLVVNQFIVLLIVCANAGSLRHFRLPDMDLDDNILEIATLCLGGLTGLAAISAEPTLAILAVLPTFALQRGAIVRELEVAASHDSKTGLLNAVAWQHVAKNEIARAGREARAVCIMILDLDFFKRVNDNFGHLVGDVALRTVGETLVRELREYDTVGRFGGEEFVIVLPGSDEMEAALVAERLRQQIAAITIAGLTGDNAHVGALSSSIGVACYPTHGEQIDQLLLGADSALYKAKQRGRNRVEFADGGGFGAGQLSLTD